MSPFLVGHSMHQGVYPTTKIQAVCVMYYSACRAVWHTDRLSRFCYMHTGHSYALDGCARVFPVCWNNVVCVGMYLVVELRHRGKGRMRRGRVHVMHTTACTRLSWLMSHRYIHTCVYQQLCMCVEE